LIYRYMLIGCREERYNEPYSNLVRRRMER